MSTLLYSLDRPARHRGLMERMARALGIDLEAGVRDGHIDQGLVERLKWRCVLCDQPDACERLLSVRPNIDAAPDYCINSRTLAELRSKELRNPEQPHAGAVHADGVTALSATETLSLRPD